MEQQCHGYARLDDLSTEIFYVKLWKEAEYIQQMLEDVGLQAMPIDNIIIFANTNKYQIPAH